MTIQRLLAPIRAPLWFLMTALLAASVAQAESAYDQRQHELGQKVIASGKKPEAAILLLKMTRALDDVDPEVTAKEWKRIADQKSVDVQHRVYARRRLAWDFRRKTDVSTSQQEFDKLGYVRAFRLIGPFDNEGKRGFSEPYPPEANRTQAVNLDAAYQGRERMVRWRMLPDVVQGGYVSFDALLRPTENVCAYAETTLTSDSARKITLWLGAGGASKLFFNGVEVISDNVYRAPHPDRFVARVSARAGQNRVLVKTCAQSGTWGFYLRVGDERGEPLVLASDPSILAAVVPAEAEDQKGAPKAVLAALEEAAASQKPNAAALENLARYLHYSGSDDPAQHRARQLAERAATAQPTSARYLLAAELAAERHEKLRLISKAEALSPKDPEVVIARALITSSGPSSERALRQLDAVPDKGAAGLDVRAVRVAMLRQLGLTETAEALVRKTVAEAPRSLSWLSRLADMLDRKTKRDEFISIQAAMFGLRNDHLGARKALIDDAVTGQREQEVLTLLDGLKALHPADERRLFQIADVYDALGKEEQVFQTLAYAKALAPESDAVLIRTGRALLRAGQTDAAADNLRAALLLKPQDAETRELLEQLAPAPRRDEAYAIDREELLKRRSDKNGHPITLLQDLTVNTVFENGLGSRFVQLGAQINDAEGARRMRARSIQFDPETQRVDVRLARVYRKDGRVLEATETYEQQLGEPWYKIYYDTRALVVVFPDLEPGDVTELRYRVDDVAPRNLFADYYGDLHYFQSGEPRVHLEYVLIAPKKREFYFNEPKLPGLRHEQTESDDARIHRFIADNVPALSSEPDLPGITEISPYLHVSTYRTWKDVGRWYWGLIRDQLYADESLKNTVRDLVKGAADDREKARRIYGWVLSHTRYVALEFGIHGYLPYRVPEIVRRGFGDCKDKASLIFTMLREAGVEARIVLVRTRRNGAIHDLPASLSVFDHAIAYVPSLDLFLDGTAEHSGMFELPAGDQGVTVLVVGPDSADLRRTPVLPSSSNERARIVHMELAPDGTGDIQVDEHIHGVDAAGYRQAYQAEGTRKDRFERALSGVYPGLSLTSLTMSGLDDVEQEVKVSYRLKAPQIARREGNDLRVAPSSLRDLLRQMAPIPKRAFPLEIGALQNYRETRTITAPAGYRLHPLPSGGEVKTPFGSLRVSLQEKGRDVVAETHFSLDVDRVAPADYAAFRAFIERADDILRQRISFAAEKP